MQRSSRIERDRRYWGLIVSLAKREISARYKGSVFGNLWSVLTPALMLAVYTFAFAEVLGMRWPQAGQTKGEFALVLFSGILFFNLFSETITRAPAAVLGNPGFVSKVVFPLEILCLVNLIAALFNFGVTLALLLFVLLVAGKPLGPEVLGLIIILVPFCAMTLGVAWALAAVGVYVRDLPQIVTLGMAALMFLAPVFYPLSLVPAKYQWLMLANPLTLPIELGRGILIFGGTAGFSDVAVYSLCAFACAVAGLLVFQRLSRGFADVI